MPSLAPDTDPSTRKKRRLRRWIALVCVLTLCAWFGRFAYLRITLRPTPRPAYWAERLAALDPPGPGAIASTEALAVLSNRPWEDRTFARFAGYGWPSPSSRWYSYDGWRLSHLPRRPQVTVQGYSGFSPIVVFRDEAFQKARAAVLAAVRAGWADVPGSEPVGAAPFSRAGALGPRPLTVSLVGGRANVPSTLAEQLQWVDLLFDHACWLRQSGSELNALEENWLALAGLARQFSRQRTVEWICVQAEIERMLAEEITAATRERRYPAGARELAVKLDRLRCQVRRPSEWLEGTRLQLHGLLEQFYVREGGWMDVSEMARYWLTRGGRPAAAPTRLWNLASPLFIGFDEARATIDREFAALDACVDLVACARAVSTSSLDESFPVLSGGVPAEWPHVSRQTIAELYLARCRLDAAVTLLALGVFRERRGAYPERLGDLVPEYLPRLPVDYADMAPMRYRREGSDYVLYSIGLDGRDHGGSAGAINSDGRFGIHEGPDIVFNGGRELRP